MEKFGKKVKFNVYKIPNDDKNDLETYLLQQGLKLIGEKNWKSYNVKFYFNKKENAGTVWWVDYFSKFFTDINSEEYQRTAYYGVVLLSTSFFSYAVSYGNAHFYIQKFCDYDFGFDLAERIVDKDSIDAKSSKYFNIDKSKELTTYSRKIPVQFDSGEASHFIEAAPLDKKIFGRKIQFSYAVKFNIDLHPKEIVSFISNINKILKSPPKFNIPRVLYLKKSENKELIFNLNNELLKSININDVNLNIAFYKIIGTNFVIDNTSKHQLIYHSKIKECQELSIDVLKEFISQSKLNDAEELRNIKIRSYTDENNSYDLNLLEFLDFTFSINDNNYCLLHGKWATFNEAYIDYLNQSIDEINSLCVHNPKFNFDSSKINTLKSQATEKLKYNEYIYNKYYMNENGFECIDREFFNYSGYQVELGDLMIRHSKEIYHVKIGNPGNLSYCIDQSRMFLKLINDKSTKNFIKKQYKLEKFEKVGLILIFDNKSFITNNTVDLKKINSIIFKTKLSEWHKVVQQTQLTPIIYVNIKE